MLACMGALLRRFGLWLCVVALAAGAWWVTARDAAEPAGLRIAIVTPEGVAVPKGQARWARAGTEWTQLPATGEGVLAWPDQVPKSEAAARALLERLRVRAPFYAQVKGASAPALTRTPSGAWHVRLPLVHHGVMELRVRAGHVGEARAYLQPDEPLRRIEAMDGRNVARVRQPAAYKIFPGTGPLRVVVEGEANVQGVNPMARLIVLLDPPQPGELIARSVEASKAFAIRGRVQWPEGIQLPSYDARVRVTQIDRDEQRSPWGHVAVEEDGSFSIPHAGALAYELALETRFAQAPDPVLVAGGTRDVLLDASTPARWATVHHDALPRPDFPMHIGVQLDGGGRARAYRPPERWTQRFHLPLDPAIRTMGVGVTVPGTRARPPQRARVALPATPEWGEVAVTAKLVEQPFGAVDVMLPAPVPRGATVTLEHSGAFAARRSTSLRGSQSTLALEHVDAGTYWLRIVWQDPDLACQCHEVVVAPGERTRLELPAPRRGRALILPDSDVSALGQSARLGSHDLSFRPRRSPLGGPCRIVLRRMPWRQGWRSREAFPAGDYRGVVVPIRRSGYPVDDDAEPVRIALTVEAVTAEANAPPPQGSPAR